MSPRDITPRAAFERFLTSDELARLGDALRQGETIGLPYAIDESKAKALAAALQRHTK